MSQIRGLIDTLNMLQDRREVDYSGIHLLEPNQTPLTAILSQLRKEETDNPEFWWFEDALLERFTRINLGAGYGQSETALVVDDSSIFVVGDVVQNTRTQENMYISGVTDSNNTITVTRGLGDTSAANISNNDEIVAIGAAWSEGSGIPQAVVTKPTKLYNYTQIFKQTVELTGTQDASKMRGQQEMAYQLEKKGKEFALDVERAFLFGSRNETTLAGRPWRQTRGLVEWISTNETNNSGASLTQAVLNNWTRNLFENGGSDSRIVFASPLFCQRVSDIARANIRTSTGEKTYGIKIMKYFNDFGDLNIVMHRMLKGDVYGAYAIALDLAQLKYRFLRGRDVKLMTNVTERQYDKITHEWVGECGLEVRHESVHGIFRNFA